MIINGINADWIIYDEIGDASLTDIKEVLEERGKRYGEFEDHASITQGIKECMKVGPSWRKCSDSQKEALEMVAHKIGRIVNGDPNYLDSWTDIVGYAQLVIDELNKEVVTDKDYKIATNKGIKEGTCIVCLPMWGR